MVTMTQCNINVMRHDYRYPILPGIPDARDPLRETDSLTSALSGLSRQQKFRATNQRLRQTHYNRR